MLTFQKTPLLWRESDQKLQHIQTGIACPANDERKSLNPGDFQWKHNVDCVQKMILLQIFGNAMVFASSTWIIKFLDQKLRKRSILENKKTTLSGSYESWGSWGSSYLPGSWNIHVTVSMVGYQVDDEPHQYGKNTCFNMSIHLKKTSCLGYQAEPRKQKTNSYFPLNPGCEKFQDPSLMVYVKFTPHIYN